MKPFSGLVFSCFWRFQLSFSGWVQIHSFLFTQFNDTDSSNAFQIYSVIHGPGLLIIGCNFYGLILY